MSHRLIYYRTTGFTSKEGGRKEVDKKDALEGRLPGSEDPKAVLEASFKAHQKRQAQTVRRSLSAIPEVADLERAREDQAALRELYVGDEAGFDFNPDDFDAGLAEIGESVKNAEMIAAIPEFKQGEPEEDMPELITGIPEEKIGESDRFDLLPKESAA